ncbi:MAG: SGNH/GDSL hydrolase family protein [Myxococcota bacterium]|nr:SGNH/GDSL hydrolase family protein [Myxococcota bacterium]
MKLRRKLLFSAVATLLGLTLLEGGVRLGSDTLAKATIPADEILAHVEGGGMSRDPLLGWKHNPLPDPSNGVNKLGWRYHKVPDPKRETWRAFAMGDSQTYGAGVLPHESWPGQAERLLQIGRGQVELINAGCSGYGSLQALRQIREQFPAYNPDLYLVDARVFDQPADEMVPPVDGALQRLLFHSRLYYWMRVLIEDKRQNTERMGGPQRSDEKTGNHQGILNQAAMQGVPVLFLDYPVWDMKLDRIVCLASVDRMPPDAELIEACKAIQADGRPGRELFFDNNHMRPEGNAIVAKAVVEAIDARGLGPERK